MSDQLFLQLIDFPFGSGVPDWDQLDLGSLAPYATEGGHAPSLFSPLQSPADFYSLLLSPLGISEPSSTPSIPSPSTPSPYIPSPLTPNLSLAGSSSAQPPVAAKPTPPAPPTPLALAWQPTPKEVTQFDFCPYTEYGQVCGYVSWARSANKQIKRHVKAEHFPDTSLGYECTNPKCTNKNYRFLRKDACNEHRRGCNLVQAPGYVPLPNIVSGNDVEVDRLMKARHKQRRKIVKNLRSGTPWSADLLEPTSF